MSERAAFWGIEQSQLGRGRFRGRIQGAHSGRVQLSRALRDPGLLVRGQVPAEAVVLSTVHRHAAAVALNGALVADDRVMRVDPGRGFDLRTTGRNDLIAVAVHAPLFHAEARAILGPAFLDAGPSDRLVLPDADSRSRLNRRLLALLGEGLARPGRLTDPGCARAWERRVLDAWLADVVTPDPGLPPAARHRAARRAESFLRSNLDRPVSIGELCLEAGVPRRTLMLGFQDVFGDPPGAYHRKLRLNAARRELARASTAETSVTAVALRWGFDHLGRFSVDYRRMFGESPVGTLRG
jgi:AraC family ethanolamine operon transcriptional activator